MNTVKKIVNQCKFDVNRANYDGRTALHIAAATGNKEIVEFLLNKNADVNAVDHFGFTPIQDAMRKDHSAIVKLLQEKGATLPNQIMGQVADIITQKGVFNSSVIGYEVTRFFTKLKMPENYFKTFTVDEIANHVHSFIAAKKVAQSTSANHDDIWLIHETENSAYYMCSNAKESIAQMEEKIEKYLDSTDKQLGYSLECFISEGVISEKNLVIYSVKRGGAKEERASARFQAVVEKSKSQLMPVIEKYAPDADGATPVMIAIQNSINKSFLGRITEIIDSIPNMRCARKFIETEKDGLVVYGLNLKAEQPKHIDEFLNKATLLSILPYPSGMYRFFIYISNQLFRF